MNDDYAPDDELTAAIADDIEQDAEPGPEQEKPQDAFNAADIASGWTAWAKDHGGAALSTGFENLDKILDGGLRNDELYVIGALPSLGKTTFATQIGDRIAAAGHSILFISLEMSAHNLVGRSISRETLEFTLQMPNEEQMRFKQQRYENYKDDTGNEGLTYRNLADRVSVCQMTGGDRPWAGAMYNGAIARYQKYAGKISIVEGHGDVAVEDIETLIKRHQDKYKETPIIIIDYMQIIAGADPKESDKQRLDRTTTKLKQLGRDYQTSIIGISSLNRQSYSDPITLSSFKESGGIEYGTDIVIGLELTGVGEKKFDAEAAKAHNPRNITLKVLKNRNGTTGKCEMRYLTHYSYFGGK